MRRGQFPTPDDPLDIGLMGQTIGIVGASRVGLPVIQRLAAFDVDVLVYDPFLSREHARGARRGEDRGSR